MSSHRFSQQVQKREQHERVGAVAMHAAQQSAQQQRIVLQAQTGGVGAGDAGVVPGIGDDATGNANQQA